jgi:hypothetical protein
MTPAAFKRTLSHAVPPKAIEPALAALWWAKKDDWEKAHRIVMDEHGRDAAWVHAYLHRVEGDEGNARYWYTRARRAAAKNSLDKEWNEIVAALKGV